MQGSGKAGCPPELTAPELFRQRGGERSRCERCPQPRLVRGPDTAGGGGSPKAGPRSATCPSGAAAGCLKRRHPREAGVAVRGSPERPDACSEDGHATSGVRLDTGQKPTDKAQVTK